jgi:hypothetical protein
VEGDDAEDEGAESGDVTTTESKGETAEVSGEGEGAGATTEGGEVDKLASRTEDVNIKDA